jgi:hypothetical protein
MTLLTGLLSILFIWAIIGIVASPKKNKKYVPRAIKS